MNTACDEQFGAAVTLCIRTMKIELCGSNLNPVTGYPDLASPQFHPANTGIGT